LKIIPFEKNLIKINLLKIIPGWKKPLALNLQKKE